MPCLVIATCLMQNYSTFFILLSLNRFQAISESVGCCQMSPHLANYEMAAQLATLDEVTKGTTAKQACYWGYWQTYLKAIELDDGPFLSAFSRSEQHRLVTAFAATVRANDVHPMQVHQWILHQYLAQSAHHQCGCTDLQG
jgi:hypothetical protein